MEDMLRAARSRKRIDIAATRFVIARTVEDALSAANDVRFWLEELARMGHLDYEADHCVNEALRDLRAVRVYLRRSQRGAL